VPLIINSRVRKKGCLSANARAERGSENVNIGGFVNAEKILEKRIPWVCRRGKIVVRDTAECRPESLLRTQKGAKRCHAPPLKNLVDQKLKEKKPAPKRNFDAVEV